MRLATPTSLAEPTASVDPECRALLLGQANCRTANMDQLSDKGLQSILESLRLRCENPVTRARRLVELEVPLVRRGPGWDRHWRELEAYLETPGFWSIPGQPK